MLLHSSNIHPKSLSQVPNSAILDCTNLTDFSGKEFLDPTADKTVKADTSNRSNQATKA